jgi:hypothetical protein
MDAIYSFHLLFYDKHSLNIAGVANRVKGDVMKAGCPLKHGNPGS